MQTKTRRVTAPYTDKRGVTRWFPIGFAVARDDGVVDITLDCLPAGGRVRIEPEGETP